MANDPKIPVIDLFAGPGGLGEGFSGAFRPSASPYRVVLSVECDQHAHRTLELRSFYRQFPHGEVPKAYYQYLRGNVSRETLGDEFPQEWAAAAAVAYRAELGKVSTKEVDRRIDEALGDDGVDWMLVGGPPCQAYSLVGRARNGRKRNAKDKRNFLYHEYLRILRKHQPTAFVMENVKGLLSAKVREDRIVEHILADLREAGYQLCALQPRSQGTLIGNEPVPADFLVECEKFGIPQARHRLIIVGIRKGVEPRRIMQLKLSGETPTLADAIRGLPALRSGLSRREGEDSGTAWAEAIHGALGEKVLEAVAKAAGGQATRSSMIKALSGLQYTLGKGGNFVGCSMARHSRNSELWRWYNSNELRGACNHESRSHISADLARYLFAACHAGVHNESPDLHDFPPSLLPEHRNATGDRNGHINFADRFRVQLESRPSTTVVSHISKDGHYFIHPDPTQCRSLTVREAARLQTFPDDYFFEGPRTEQYRQVGNAVPPLLAKQIAETMFVALFGNVTVREPDGGQNQQEAPKLEHVTHQGA